MEISCDEKGLRDAPEVEFKFWLDTLPYPHIIYFRWGRDVAAAKDGLPRGQFLADPSLCEKVKKIIEEVALGVPRNATVRLKDATLTAKCNGDDLWGTSLEFHLDLTLNEHEPPSTPTTQLPKSR